jgi:hypothetical protein
LKGSLAQALKTELTDEEIGRLSAFAETLQGEDQEQE